MCLLDSWFSLSYFYSSGPACYLNERGEAGWGSRAGGVGGGVGVVNAVEPLGFR